VLEKLLIAISVFAIVLMLALTYLTARFIDHEEILQAKAEAEQLRASRDSLLTEVTKRDSLQRELQTEVSDLRSAADTLRAHVFELEQERAENQLTVRNLRRKEDLQQRFRETFPEVASSDWGVTEVFNENANLDIEYLLTPLWFAETFIIDHQNAKSFEAQRDTLMVLDSLQTQVIALQDTIFRLEEKNKLAYQDGYNEAFTKYEVLNGKYIELLQKPPQVSMGLPSWGTILLSTAGGVILGTQIK